MFQWGFTLSERLADGGKSSSSTYCFGGMGGGMSVSSVLGRRDFTPILTG